MNNTSWLDPEQLDFRMRLTFWYSVTLLRGRTVRTCWGKALDWVNVRDVVSRQWIGGEPLRFKRGGCSKTKLLFQLKLTSLLHTILQDLLTCSLGTKSKPQKRQSKIMNHLEPPRYNGLNQRSIPSWTRSLQPFEHSLQKWKHQERSFLTMLEGEHLDARQSAGFSLSPGWLWVNPCRDLWILGSPVCTRSTRRGPCTREEVGCSIHTGNHDEKLPLFIAY